MLVDVASSWLKNQKDRFIEQTDTSRFHAVDLILIIVLLAGALLRASGLFWGENQFLHPDERFLVWVGTDISPVENISEYFDTANSSLNPHNRGHGFYVYGTLPMFLTRYAVEWIFGHSGFAEMTQIGRTLSAAVDLLTVLLVYLLAARIYNRRIAILASAFSAFAVLQIQQSHFFTMDTFINFFTYLAFYFAVRIATGNRPWESIHEPSAGEGKSENAGKNGNKNPIARFLKHPLFIPCLGFGLALGMAVASKLNAAPMAFMLPAALLLRCLRFPQNERNKIAGQAVAYLILAGVLSFLTFRMLQPYAFSGPGFLGMKPNPLWMANLKELRAQSSGDVDFPPAMQWARRSFFFSGINLTLWGLGLPLGAAAWAGFVWAGWRILKSILKQTSEWQIHILIWGWTAVYFMWQSLSLTPSLRYQLPVYPTLVIFASWFIFNLYEFVKKTTNSNKDGTPRKYLSWSAPIAAFVGIIILAATIFYAFAFSRIYTREITRIAASRWIYQNIPGAINLRILTDDGTVNQPLPFPYESYITPEIPYSHDFQAAAEGELKEVFLPQVSQVLGDNGETELKLTVSDLRYPGTSAAEGTFRVGINNTSTGMKNSYSIILNKAVYLMAGNRYNLLLEVPGESPVLQLAGEGKLGIQPVDSASMDDTAIQEVILPETSLRINEPLTIPFQPIHSGSLNYLILESSPLSENLDPNLVIQAAMTTPGEDLTAVNSDVAVQISDDRRGLLLTFENPFPLISGEGHVLLIQLKAGDGAVSLHGEGIANEGEWDDGLPLRLDGYDGFGGIYPIDLNFNMYWEDSPEKAQRFIKILDNADFVVISSSRQWGSLPRIPERFPLVTRYYRMLLGCPENRKIEWCYNVAQPGIFNGQLGYKLVKVFQSNPGIGPIQINDQPAEEAFTVYDHPKVFIFEKTEEYDPDTVRNAFETIDYSNLIRLPPMKFPPHPVNLMLPEYRLSEQIKNGTWSEIFNTAAVQNRYPIISVILWYLALSLLGLICYPIIRLALPGLNDHGYPIARISGLLLLSYLVWTAGSFRIPFNRSTITASFGLILLIGVSTSLFSKNEILRDFRRNPRYFIWVEAITLAFFTAFLLVRLGNPDLWHPWKGGEKPMDFAYLNAVLKSSTFPPYDPWFAGGYLHYYYYGFVFSGVMVKLLGITPSIAYNLILATLFSMIAMGAFSIAWNLYTSSGMKSNRDISDGELNENSSHPETVKLAPHPVWIGLAGAFAMAVLGNLGTVKMILHGYQKLIAPGGVLEGATLFNRISWTIQGFFESAKGASLPYGIGDWYWIPSRIIPAQGDVEPITEFPYFTALYGDPHAHLFALPVALLVLSICLSFILSRVRWKGLFSFIPVFLLAGLAIGALKPTNTSDFYPYLLLGISAVVYSFGRYFRLPEQLREKYPALQKTPDFILRASAAVIGASVLVLLANLLYYPYTYWSDFGYGAVDMWEGTHTPMSAYLNHWILFLFVIVAWMIWETIDWMASTPASSLRKLKPYWSIILSGIILMIAVMISLAFMGVYIGWLAIPLAAWAGILLLRPGISESKRFVLFLVGTSLVLTLLVEVVVVVGDIGRMNTVFKFYLQVWTMLSVCAAGAFGWSMVTIDHWNSGWRKAWIVGLTLLVSAAALYPLMATTAKIKDRMAPEAPHTLDGMAFMKYAHYGDTWGEMDLKQDYDAIRWMQENVEGSPIIVEANLRNLYRWGSRFSIYTGLPGVVGWEWHQQQQRTSVPASWISDRIAEVDSFYYTTDLLEANEFLKKYDVHYIILGQQERGHYPGEGLEKFDTAEGLLWQEVYRDGETVIYEVIED